MLSMLEYNYFIGRPVHTLSLSLSRKPDPTIMREQNLHQGRQAGPSRSAYLPSSQHRKKIQETIKQNQANEKLSVKPKPISEQFSKPASAEQKAKTALRTQGSYLDAQRIAEEAAAKRSKVIKTNDTESRPASLNVQWSEEQMMLDAASDSHDDW